MKVELIFFKFLSYQILEKFFQTPLFRSAVFDVIINLIHPFPWFDSTIYIKSLGHGYKIKFQTFMYSLTFLKTYLIVRTYTLHTHYSGLESHHYW